jgi:NitT/TauT family transport system ATP-binding protein
MIAVTKAAELLDLVDTPKRQVVLTAVGSRFVAAGAEERQAIWSQRILGLRLFQEVRELVQRHGKVDDALIMEIMALRMPNENYEQMFRAFVGWARFGNLFAYDERTGILSSP